VRFSPTEEVASTGSVSFTGGGGTTKEVTGTGAPPTFTLTVTKGGSGDGGVTSNPTGINCGMDCTQDFDSGRIVTLTANAVADSTFKGWMGGGCTGSGDCMATINADTIVTATFSRIFTDDHLTLQVTLVKAQHFTEALEAINTLRSRNGLGNINFTAPLPASGVTIIAKHMITLQTGLNAIFDALGRTRPTFDTVVAGVTVIGKPQIDKVRNAIRALE